MKKLFMVFTISFSFVSTDSKVILLEFDVLSLKYVFIVFQKVACPLYYWHLILHSAVFSFSLKVLRSSSSEIWNCTSFHDFCFYQIKFWSFHNIFSQFFSHKNILIESSHFSLNRGMSIWNINKFLSNSPHVSRSKISNYSLKALLKLSFSNL